MDKKTIFKEYGAVIRPLLYIGNRAIILKGSHIGDNCIAGTSSTVTHRTEFRPGCVIAGNPAMITRDGVSWYADRNNFE